MPIAVSSHEKYRPLTTVQFCVHGKLKLGDQIVDMHGLKDRYPHQKNLPSQILVKTKCKEFLARLLRHPSPLRIQAARRQNCAMGSKIENRMGLKWSFNSEASGNSCYNSILSIRGQVIKSADQIVGHQILRLKL